MALETRYPKPNTGDSYITETWTRFEEKYLRFSNHILGDFLGNPEMKASFQRPFIQQVALSRQQPGRASMSDSRWYKRIP